MRILACDLSAFDAAERARHSALRDELRARRLDVREVAEGYAFSYPADSETFVKLAEFVALERRCCPFFDFTLDIVAGAAQVHLTIGGGSDVKEFLRAQQG